ncbi:nucleoside-diphosphate kinase [Patescibacteria group bacterium]
MTEKTLVFIKPDGMRRTLAGEIIKRFERAGLTMVACKLTLLDEKTAKEHYKEHAEKDFFPHIINFITSAPIIIMVFEGVEAVENVRKLVGDTYPNEAKPGTIRGDFAHIDKDRGDKKDIGVSNLIHASSDKGAAKEETERFFDKSEIHSWKRCDDEYVR